MYTEKDYIQGLISKISSAKIIEHKNICIGAWYPKEHRCHDNVARLCELDSSYKNVYGFLYSDTPEFGEISFIFHSVVKDLNGNLIDITPTSAIFKYPFIESGIQDEAYEELMYMYEKTKYISVSLISSE
jgi:hypothetical protein